MEQAFHGLRGSAGLKMPIHANVFRRSIFNHKVGQTDLVFFACAKRSLVGPCMQDYKSLCATVVICSTLVNIQTHSHTDRQHLTSLYDKLSQMS